MLHPFVYNANGVDRLPFVCYADGMEMHWMATPGELVEALSGVLGVNAATVTQYDRALAENGLRSKGGRGTSAAKVTAKDAANLLLAILGSPISGASIKEAPVTCNTYGSLPVLKRAVLRDNFPKFGFPSLARLPRQHCLVDGLVALIEGASKGEEMVTPIAGHEPITGPNNDAWLSVQLDGPLPWAQIIADGSIGTQNEHKIARFVYCNAAAGSKRKFLAMKFDDLEQRRSITFRTIRKVGELLAAGPDAKK